MNPNIPLFRLAIVERNAAGVASLIKSGTIDVNARVLDELEPEHLTFPLVLAATTCRVETVRVLLDAGALIDAIGACEQTACMAAARAGAGDIVELLIERGADLSIRDNCQCSALTIGVMLARSSDRIVAALIEAGASLDEESGKTLCDAASLSARVCHMLLDRNVNVRQLRNQFGATALHSAAARWECELEVLDVLVNVAHVDLHAVDESGFTCLHRLTARSPHKVRWLVNCGADIDARDNDGMTPLHRACDCRQDIVALSLVAAGANVRMLDNFGRTACHMAADTMIDAMSLHPDQRQEHEWMLCLMIAAGSDFESAFDVLGVSPQQRAARRNLRAPTADEIQSSLRSIAIAQLDFVRERAFEVCVGLAPLHLNALQMCEILVQSCGPVAPLIKFHHWWKIATIVKHFFK